MEKNSSKAIIIGLVVIIIIMIAALLVALSTNLVSFDKANIITNDNNGNKAKEENKNNEVQIVEKEVIKNTFVKFDTSKIQNSGNKKIENLSCQWQIDTDFYFMMKLNSAGEITAFAYGSKLGFKEVNSYKVALNKKVVGIYALPLGQSYPMACVCVMEDGTVEALKATDGKITSNGTISGVTNVVRIESADVKEDMGNGGGSAYKGVFAVQGDGKIIEITSSC